MAEEPSDREDTVERPFSTEEAERSLRRERLAAEAEVRARLGSAVLELAGRHGYSALTVQMILDQTGTSRATFYALFSGKAACFASAYDVAAADLERELLASCETTRDWLQGLREALASLARLLVARPSWALAVLAEAQVAGGAASARRKEVFERLTCAMDRARREIGSSRHSPPPITAAFILNAIESAAVRSLTYDRGRGFRDTVPELVYFATAPYFGTEAAAAAYSEARRK